jgi:hypothetical protein
MLVATEAGSVIGDQMNKARIQWKAAMTQMMHANQVAAEIDPTKGTFTQRAARNIAERHLDRYFEMVEAELNHREQQWLTSR